VGRDSDESPRFFIGLKIRLPMLTTHHRRRWVPGWATSAMLGWHNRPE
jgi:hypothetical protein